MGDQIKFELIFIEQIIKIKNGNKLKTLLSTLRIKKYVEKLTKRENQSIL